MKKFLIALLVAAIAVLGYLYATGKLSLIGLKSDALNASTCSPEYIAEKTAAYKQTFVQRQESKNQIELIKAALVKLEEQKNLSGDENSESILADITAQEKSVVEFEKEVTDDTIFIDEYEACKQSLIVQGIMSGEGTLTSGEVVVTPAVEETTPVVTETAPTTTTPEPPVETSAEAVAPAEAN